MDELYSWKKHIALVHLQYKITFWPLQMGNCFAYLQDWKKPNCFS